MKLRDYREKIKEYHQFHKDTNIRIIKVLYKDEFKMFVLVRVRDEDGVNMSCIDEVKDDDVRGITGGDADFESEMIERFMGYMKEWPHGSRI